MDWTWEPGAGSRPDVHSGSRRAEQGVGVQRGEGGSRLGSPGLRVGELRRQTHLGCRQHGRHRTPAAGCPGAEGTGGSGTMIRLVVGGRRRIRGGSVTLVGLRRRHGGGRHGRRRHGVAHAPEPHSRPDGHEQGADREDRQRATKGPVHVGSVAGWPVVLKCGRSRGEGAPTMHGRRRRNTGPALSAHPAYEPRAIRDRYDPCAIFNSGIIRRPAGRTRLTRRTLASASPPWRWPGVRAEATSPPPGSAPPPPTDGSRPRPHRRCLVRIALVILSLAAFGAPLAAQGAESGQAAATRAVVDGSSR